MTDETAGLPPHRSADETPTRSQPPIPDVINSERTVSLSGAPQQQGWIAGYRIIRKLGEGGMGIVYEAEQKDPRRLVALKVIRGGPHVDEYTVKLFQREIHTLALLKHPGIAAIYEAGRTEDGQHFFAMELVRGVALNEYVRARRPPEEDRRVEIMRRIDLFLKICDAINYAHQRGVIHRDLKPSNILVLPAGADSGSTDAAVKVLDFGLARITESDVGSATVLTHFGQIQGTLPYMSPEQARGIPGEIDVRTDVYSLGVILYQLLTDRLPYQVTGSAIHEAVRVICEETPERPSSINQLLRGDLETIALKALDKTVAGRYQSVLALSEDIGRYLTNQPIMARPPSTIYQLRKLIVRHKGAFAFAATMVVLLAAFAITMSAMYGVQRRERLRADAEREKALEINKFLQEMLSSSDPRQALGREVTVREVLDKASERMEAGLADQPEIQAAVRSTIGNTYMSLGLYDVAEPYLSEALAARRRTFGESHPEVASSMNDLGRLMWEKGDYDAAEPQFREALKMTRATRGERHPDVAKCLNDLGLLLKSEGNYAEAESLLTDALTLQEVLLSHENPEVAVSLGNLAALAQEQGRYAEAESLYHESLAIRRKLLAVNHPDIAVSLNNLANTLLLQGKYAEAEPLLRESTRLAKETLGQRHTSTATKIANLALALNKLGKFEEAETSYREALEVYKRAVGEEHPMIAACLNNLAGLLENQERFPEAETLYREALTMRRKLLGEEHPEVAVNLNNLAIALQGQGRLNEAEPLYRQALDMRRKLLGDKHPRVASSLLGLGTLLAEKGDAKSAEPLIRESLEIFRATESDKQWLIAYAENSLGHCLAVQRRFGEAESLLVRGIPVLLSSTAAPSGRKRGALESVIAFYQATSRPDLAARYRENLKELRKQ